MKKRGTRFERIINDIKSIKIQGSTNIAKAGIEAYLIQPDKKSAEKIIATRPTEPLMQNAVKTLEKSINKKKSAKLFLKYIKKSEEKISKRGAELIKNNMNIFTHCHSKTVVNILIRAKKQKKHFVVYNTETYPLFQGRKTAKELAKAGIKIIHMDDKSAEYALKKSDLFLFGSDAFTPRGVVNKSGTAMYCEIAKLHNVPRYSCGVALKYADKIRLEQRKGNEVWNEHEKNIQVLNPAFDLVNKKLLTGVITELGVMHYGEFLKKIQAISKTFL